MPTEKQRRAAERRRLQRQLRRRAQREARRHRFALIASIVGALVVIAIVIFFVVQTGSDNSSPPAAKSRPPTCTWTKTQSAAAKPVTVPPTRRPPKTGTVSVLVGTNRGTMTFQLNRAEAPCAVESFVSLVQQKFYDSTPCHRLTSGNLSVLQCGDPTGTGSGGPGYSFADELSGHEKYTRGVLAMANSGANTNGSQFFIVYKDSQLQPNYTIFGKVSSDMQVVDRVAAKGSTPAGDGKPKLPIKLISLTITE